MAHEAGEQVREGSLHGVAQQHRGQGDADLGAGQEGGQPAQGAPDGGGALVAGGGAGLDGGGVEGDQGELSGHEQGGAHGEDHADGDHEPVGHAGPSPTWDAAWAPEADESGWGWSEAGEEARCVRVRRLEARRKADRIVTERYHRGSSKAETGAMPQVRIAGALNSHDSGNLRHRLSQHGGCDAATEATESGPLNRPWPVRLMAPSNIWRRHCRSLDSVLRNAQRSMDNRRRHYRSRCWSNSGSNTPAPRLGLHALPQATNRRISRGCNRRHRTTLRVPAGT